MVLQFPQLDLSAMHRVLSLSLPAAVMMTAIGLAGCKPKEAAGQDPLVSDRIVAVATVGSAAAASGRYTGVVGARVESGLGFRVQGKIIDRLVDTGQVVRKGQPLMRIDPTDYAHALVAQTGNVAAAQAKWIQADADEKRYRGLVGSGAVSQSAYDQAKAAADSAKALMDAAAAQEKVANPARSWRPGRSSSASPMPVRAKPWSIFRRQSGLPLVLPLRRVCSAAVSRWPHVCGSCRTRPIPGPERSKRAMSWRATVPRLRWARP
jgi:multidrug efflux pump subunit AcrA (membrane-fusion protein)